MKTVLLLIVFSLALFAQAPQEAYKNLLAHAVCNGHVDYVKLHATDHVAKAETEFQSITEATFEGWPDSEQLAWLNNLYNFYTIKLIVDKKPSQSIQDLKSPWDTKFINLFEKKVSLNHIEHQIIRKKYDEPLIHFALVCAAQGCPPLRGTPFTGANLTVEMQEQATIFLNNPKKNRYDGKTLYVSQIFQWYGIDFKKRYGSYQNYVKEQLGIEGRVKIKFTDYDWSLNQTHCE